MAHRLNHVAGAGFAFRADHGRPFIDAAERFAQIPGTADERDRKLRLLDVEFLIGGCKHLALVDHVHAEDFEHLCFDKVSDSDLAHHRDGDRLNDFDDFLRVGHPCNAPRFPDIGWYPFERHHRNGAGFFCNPCLLGVHDIHDHAAFLHGGKPPLKEFCSMPEL